MYISKMCVYIYIPTCIFLMYPFLLECKLHKSRCIILLCIVIFSAPKMIHSKWQALSKQILIFKN